MCDKLATVIGQTKLTIFATIDVRPTTLSALSRWASSFVYTVWPDVREAARRAGSSATGDICLRRYSARCTRKRTNSLSSCLFSATFNLTDFVCSQHIKWTQLKWTDTLKSTQLHDVFTGHGRQLHDYASYDGETIHVYRTVSARLVLNSVPFVHTAVRELEFNSVNVL